MMEMTKGTIKTKNIQYTISKLAGWILILVLSTGCLFTTLGNRFNGNLEDIDLDAFIAYKNSIWIIVIVTGGLAFLWWVLPFISLKIKDFYERNTLACAVVTAVIHICVTVVIQYKFPGVNRRDEEATLIELRHVWSYPFLFIGGILLFSPNSVCEVIVPFNKRLRRVVGWFCIIIGITGYLWGGK